MVPAAGQCAITVIAAGAVSLFIKADGSLWGMGYHGYGELGDGTWNSTNQPEQIISKNVVGIAGEDNHSLIIKSDGSLWVHGANWHEQIGDGTENNANAPEQIVSSNVGAIASGFGHSLFTATDGSLRAMGWNGEGQLGDGAWYDLGISPHYQQPHEQSVRRRAHERSQFGRWSAVLHSSIVIDAPQHRVQGKLPSPTPAPMFKMPLAERRSLPEQSWGSVGLGLAKTPRRRLAAGELPDRLRTHL